MDRRWSILCAALLGAHVLLQVRAGDVLRERVLASAESIRRAAPSAVAAERFCPPAGDGSPWADPTPAPAPGPERPRTPPPDEPGELRAEVLPFTDEAGSMLKNNTDLAVDIPSLMEEEISLRLPKEGPQVLILHTHATEAYLPVPGAVYPASDPFRTLDASSSVIRVGEVLARALEEQGLRVVHDAALNDYPSYAGAYDRSLAEAESWLARYPDIAVIIDLHRDAVGSEEVVYKTCTRLPEESAAQVMLVIGTGENGLEHPLWRENLKLALALQSAMDSASPTLARPIHLARERYNQHLCTGAFILEVGTNGNTLAEAERAAELFARAAGPVLLSLADGE